jgi:hypothetical protein
VTATASPTAPLPASFTATPTSSATRTLTPSPSFTPINTAVASATFTPAAAPPSDGPLVLRRVLPFPNPNPLSLALELEGPADQVSLKLYSRAEVAVYALEGGPAPAGWSRLSLPGGWDRELPNGVYFGVLQASRAGAKSNRALVKIGLLR